MADRPVGRKGPREEYDVVLVGAGIMSATLGLLLSELEPSWRICVLERLVGPAMESSDAWNNAGTGHAGLCEFNYTPQRPDGTVDISSAVAVNEQFLVSRQFWSHLLGEGLLGAPESFVNAVPHMSFAQGPDGMEYLRQRYRALKDHPLFAGMEYSEDMDVLARWLPLMFDTRREDKQVAVSRSSAGTDIDYGALTRQLLAALQTRGATIEYSHEVTAFRRSAGWRLEVRDHVGHRTRLIGAGYVFVGAGGGTLPLLQKAGLPEVRRFAGFPISGQFYRCDDPRVVSRHRAKVYGHAAAGSPAVSVPHLDTRVVEGRSYLLFGPYAAFSPRFLKQGRWTDLIRSVSPANVPVLWRAARDNRSLIRYLVRQMLQTRRTRLVALRAFVPDAQQEDWTLITAGQRVQLVKAIDGKGTIVGFGTEVVTSADGSLGALLGASPGASASVAIMLDVMQKCFPERMARWTPRLQQMLPSYGSELAWDPALLVAVLAQTDASLGLGGEPS